MNSATWMTAAAPAGQSLGRKGERLLTELGGGAKLADRLRGVLRLEDGRARDEDRRAVLGERTRVLELHAAVDGDVHAARAKHRADLSDLRIDGGDELLAAEARIHRHHEDQVEIVLHPLERGRGGRRIQRRARLHGAATLAGELADRGERAVQVRARLDV